MTDHIPSSRLDGIAILLGALALILAVVVVVQSASNRALQQKIATGQAKLAQAQTMANLDNSLVQLMAKAAADRNDSALRNLLARNGVTFKTPPVPAAQPEVAK
jgi:cell division protein FtsB